MENFIEGICAISPQNTFTGDNFLRNIVEYDNVKSVKCIEPPYNELLDPMVSRRMSRIIKMGVTSAIKCLNEAGINNPDAIITGTGLGCIEDTEKFLGSIYKNGEKLLNPTPFIQSTHNTIASNIAILLKCNSYNNNYSHRGFSFESALMDSLMLLQEGSANKILLGAVDELTANSFIITSRLGFWKKESVNNLHLLDYKSRGSIAGEGSAFFVLTNKESDRSMAKIVAIDAFYKPEGVAETELRLSAFLEKNLTDSDQTDLILMGLNGDNVSDRIYYHLQETLFRNKPCAFFKHLCGEYDTSTSFALFLAARLLREQYVPEIIRLDNKPIRKIKNILIYNHLRNTYHTMILLTSC